MLVFYEQYFTTFNFPETEMLVDTYNLQEGIVREKKKKKTVSLRGLDIG